MLKKLLWVLAAFCWCSYCYSESIAKYYGQTGNAARDGLTWDMSSILPIPPGLFINNVLYKYTIRKAVEDAVTVNVQNQNATGTGYIFRETDQWNAGSMDGTGIRKVIGVGSVNRSLWGDGSIEVQGNGRVENPSVLYTYTVDPCYDPQFDPNCPGYKKIIPEMPKVDYTIYDATSDADREQYQDGELYDDEKRELTEEELEELEKKEKEDREERLEKALSEADTSEFFAVSFAQAQILQSIDAATNINSYYTQNISGGVYNESISLPSTELPDNKQGLRNGLAQQLLHIQMVGSQYK
jgi:hypothetical protein